MMHILSSFTLSENFLWATTNFNAILLKSLTFPQPIWGIVGKVLASNVNLFSFHLNLFNFKQIPAENPFPIDFHYKRL